MLLPQIETALRNLLAMLGAPVMKPTRYHRAFQAIGLGEALSHQYFRASVPEDVRRWSLIIPNAAHRETATSRSGLERWLRTRALRRTEVLTCWLRLSRQMSSKQKPF